MAKKKNIEPDEDLGDDIGDLGDEEIESVYPDIEKKPSKTEEVSEKSVKKVDDVSEEEYEEDLELDLKERPEIPDYKYLNLKLNQGAIENDYELEVIGQSHGFCNIFIKHLLNLEGVNIAAYKVTGIEPSKIFIRLEKGYKIKDILYKGIESLKEEVAEVQKLFQNLI